MKRKKDDYTIYDMPQYIKTYSEYLFEKAQMPKISDTILKKVLSSALQKLSYTLVVFILGYIKFHYDKKFKNEKFLKQIEKKNPNITKLLLKIENLAPAIKRDMAKSYTRMRSDPLLLQLLDELDDDGLSKQQDAVLFKKLEKRILMNLSAKQEDIYKHLITK